ncbi:hypothetical protein ACOR62_09335 [Neisseria lisongii]|uniref:Uncharacterized protein n=1 Tax=Neisseria lisongii TaxID=2912188 RepID=A0AAW5AJQ5_9NEIS|nr:hypothetical protein [Neisseria lisongii]MCF7530122.1 hypothetical protein [Neisseria lisongii]
MGLKPLVGCGLPHRFTSSLKLQSCSPCADMVLMVRLPAPYPFFRRHLNQINRPVYAEHVRYTWFEIGRRDGLPHRFTSSLKL